MRLTFGVNATERTRGDLPALPVVNLFAEQAPSEQTGIVLQSRPGLTDRVVDMGAGPVAALFKADGVLDSGLYGISNSAFYKVSTSLGAVDGAGPFFMAGFEDYLFAAGGGSIWGYDGATLSALTFPDSANVTKVVVGASRLIAIRADTEKFYWSDVLSTTIDALSFATAEQQPDRLKDILFWSDALILFGTETVEFWPNTSDPDLPFQVLEGRTFRKGIRGTGCATLFGPSFAWVSDTNQVCIENPDQVVSGPGLEAKIEASASVRLWTFQLEGTEFLALTLDEETWVYSYRSRLWSQFESAEADNFIPQCFAGEVFGSSIDGKTMTWGTNWEDLGGTLERRFRAGAPMDAGGMILAKVQLRTNPGNTGYLTGTYLNPTVEMRSSRDAGRTWGAWRTAKLGEQGNYRKLVQWLACGMASRPGVFLEFRCSDPVDLRISDVLVNEGWGGI
jgi:hypothetical protein